MAKRSATALRRRHAAGEDIENERALIRVGRTTTRVLTGLDDLSDWSEEELKRGQRKNKNGTWTGRKPQVIPVAVHNELVRRSLKRAETLFQDALEDAVQCLIDVVNGQAVEDRDKIKAAGMIIDRVMGKTPERVEIKAAQTKMQEAFKAMLVPTDEDDAYDSIDVDAREN